MVKRIIRKMVKHLVGQALPKFKAGGKVALDPHSKLRVNLVTSWNIRCGVAAYSAFLADELKERADVRVVNLQRELRAFSPYFLILGFKASRVPSIVHVQFEYSLFPALKIGIKKTLLSFGAFLFYIGLALGKSQVVTTFHEVRTVKAGGKTGYAYVNLLHRLIFRVSNLIVVHNSESKTLMEKIYGVNKLKIIPHGLYETPIFLDQNECKKQFGLSGKTVVTIPGFISPAKGHDLVISILPQLDKNVNLIIAGGTKTDDGNRFLEKLKELAQSHGCLDRITFTGYLPDLTVVINATDVAILPYRAITESGILRLLIAHRIPTITSDLPAFKEVLQEYDCIKLFEGNNKEKLLESVCSLINSEKTRDYLKEQCLKMWENNRWRAIARRHMETYLELISGHPDFIYDEEKQRERIDWLKENVSGSALEIGCAGGFVTSYANADVGLDINPWRIKFAKVKHPEKDFIIASAAALPFKGKAFDTVLIPEILEHVQLDYAEKIVTEAKNVANKIVATVPNADKENYDKLLVENQEHLWFPTKKIILDLMGNCVIEYSTQNDFMLIQWS